MATHRAARRAPIGLLELAQRIRAWSLSDKAGYDTAIALFGEVETAIRIIVGPVPGMCGVCGCTETDACEGGCWWADAAHTVCSSRACLEAAGLARRARARGKGAPAMRRKRTGDESPCWAGAMSEIKVTAAVEKAAQPKTGKKR